LLKYMYLVNVIVSGDNKVNWGAVALLAALGPLAALALVALVQAGADPWLLGKGLTVAVLALAWYMWEKEEKRGKSKN